jgi:hypothetical protein
MTKRARPASLKTKTQKKCADCGAPGVWCAGPLGWLCAECATRRINAPENVELTQADEELNEHLDKGGKLS